jgi:hypothetical protein
MVNEFHPAILTPWGVWGQIATAALNARLGTQNAFENILKDAELIPDNRGLPRIDIYDASIFQSILGKARHLVALVKTHRNDLAARFLGFEKGPALGHAGNVIIAVTLEIDAGGRGWRAQNAFNLGF